MLIFLWVVGAVLAFLLVVAVQGLSASCALVAVLW